MSQFNDTGYKGFTAGGAIAQFLRVKLVAGLLQIAGATDKDLGPIRTAAFASGDFKTVVLRSKQGTAQYLANGAISAGADVFSAASGKVSATPSVGSFYIGTALEATSADGDVVEVLHGRGSPQTAANLTFSPAAGSANVSLVTIQVQDQNANNLAGEFVMDVWLSDAATGIGLTATTASGAVAAGASGTDLGVLTAKKATRVITDATGKYILSITDTAKTGFYVAASVPGLNQAKVSAQLITANYG